MLQTPDSRSESLQLGLTLNAIFIRCSVRYRTFGR